LASAFLRRLLAHPLTASLDLDDPATTELRRRIIASKPILKSIYDEWYTMIAKEVPPGAGFALELGSGGGYAAEFIPGLITSEVFLSAGIQVVSNAQALPFANGSLRAIVMTNVLHHVPKVRLFFLEATRCLRPGGKILMIEPWVTPWSRLIYRKLHHEPFDTDAQDWEFAESGPLSGANGALPWILFSRDQKRFLEEFPRFQIECVRPFLPFRYLVSGGVGMRSLVPGFTYTVWTGLERLMEPQMARLAMFAFLSVRKLSA
jgi:SAM-dependent methyltransferase